MGLGNKFSKARRWTVALACVAGTAAPLGNGTKGIEDWRYYTTENGRPVPGLPDGVEGRIWQGNHGVYDVVLAAPNAVRFSLSAGASLGSRRGDGTFAFAAPMHWSVTQGNVTFEAGGPTYEAGDVFWAGAGMAHGPIATAGGAIVSAVSGGPRLEPAQLFAPAERVETNPSVETYSNASSPKLRGYRGADAEWHQNPSNHSAECLANGGVWNKWFDGVGDSPPVLRVRWSANCSIPFHYHPTGAIYWILYGRMYFVDDCGTGCEDRAVGRGEIRWVRPGFSYGPEHNDYDAPCEITVLGVNTNPTFEQAPSPYRVEKRVLVDYVYP